MPHDRPDAASLHAYQVHSNAGEGRPTNSTTPDGVYFHSVKRVRMTYQEKQFHGVSRASWALTGALMLVTVTTAANAERWSAMLPDRENLAQMTALATVFALPAVVAGAVFIVMRIAKLLGPAVFLMALGGAMLVGTWLASDGPDTLPKLFTLQRAG